ncbi:hypothetical protein FSB78_08405 [Sphingomonas ginsenosidivorax]|uniref:Type I restriction modification DNA specificity domain-containing protein n=1 Tax=Sphingomonas ginsenosidivorax TaxID=862135 RepID=A0A5C6UEB6_9SPHN|nr:restriction endonuclease subunit S [Sphingomonas ginsenosidivorax]TXC70964.1 hypothetical protein FSB78_08405 [Sphingomonas ginsenosidivorax]
MAGRAATSRIIRGRHAISVNDPGHPIPRGWRRVALGDVADLGTGHTPSRHHPEYWDGGVPWIGIRDAGAHHGRVIVDTMQTVSDLGLANSAARLLPKDTVCLSRTASVGYVVKMGREMATSQDFVTWSCLEPLDADYLMNALLAEGQDIRRFGEGSTHTTIYFPEVKAFHIDLPPKPEQRRIVAKLDAMTAGLSRARVELDRVPMLTQKLRTKILLEAFSGDFPTSALRDLVHFVTSGSRGWAKYYADTGPAFIRVGDVRRRNIALELNDVQSVQPPSGAEGARTALLAGDVVITITADLGRVGVVPESLGPGFVNQHVALARPLNVEMAPWIGWYLSSEAGQGQMLAKNRGVTKAGLGLDDIRDVVIPVPTADVRASMLNKINTAFASADRLEAEAARARALLDRLESAILAKAFRGELVPQDPNDEPASVLLDRIRAERADAPKPKRGRRAAASA